MTLGSMPPGGVLRSLGTQLRRTRSGAATGQRRLSEELARVRRQVEQLQRQLAQMQEQGREQVPDLPSPPEPAPFGTAEVVATGADGRATWHLPAPMQAPPVVAAAVVDPSPGDSLSYSVALESVTADTVVARAWRTRTLLGLGLLVPTLPAGPGVLVHLVAVGEPQESP